MIQSERALLEPLFAPGIWNNTVKGGLALGSWIMTVPGGAEVVDAITDISIDFAKDSGNTPLPEGVINFGSGSLLSCSALSLTDPGKVVGYVPQRIPFEAIYKPAQYLSYQAISGGYIYDNGIASASLSASWVGEYEKTKAWWHGGGDSLYQLAADNVLCSISDWFMQPQVSFVSKREAEFTLPEIKKGDKFALTLHVNRTLDSTGDADRSRFEMYDRVSAFGPPFVADIATQVSDGVFEHSATLAPNNHSFTYGSSSVTIVCTSSFTGQPYLSELFAGAEFLYSRAFETGSTHAGHAVLEDNAVGVWFAQQVSESFNLTEVVISDTPGTEPDKRWAIQSKFETPVLNFNDASVTRPYEPASDTTTPVRAGCVTSSVSRGMWHQYGALPSAKEGVAISITTPAVVDSPTYGRFQPKSLANLVGFEEGVEKYIGGLKRAYVLEEAVVIVPYIQLKTKRKFLTFPRKNRKNIPSYQKLRAAMNKYVFPPPFDFARFSSVRPVVAYIFEFNKNF